MYIRINLPPLTRLDVLRHLLKSSYDSKVEIIKSILKFVSLQFRVFFSHKHVFIALKSEDWHNNDIINPTKPKKSQRNSKIRSI